MAANARWKGLPWIVATGAVVVGLVLLLVLLTRSAEPPGAATPPPPIAEAAAPVPEAASPPSTATASASQAGAGAVPALLREPEPEPADDAPQVHPVDLETLRAKLPDNLYWELAAPTTNPDVLRRREEDTRRWNDAYGKVLSGDATEEEIHQYYAHRREVSEDMVAFASTVLAEYGDRLPEQERGLYELSIDMHRTRLKELPGQERDSLAHRQAQEQRRQAWRQGRQTP